MIISLVSQKGGSAKSTLAVSIAWELMARGRRVLLVDTDPQATVRAVGEQAAAANRAAPTIVQMGSDLYKATQLPRLAESFDDVVIDTPGRSGDVQHAALIVSDVALIPVGQSGADVWSLGKTLEVIEQTRALKPQLKVALVVTRKMPRTALGKALRPTLDASGIPVFASETTVRVSWQECMSAGMGVAQYAPRDAAAAELRALVDELIQFAEGTSVLEVSNG